MRSDKLLAALIAGTAACGAVLGQHITRVEGPNTSALDVRVIDELNPSAAGSILLQGISILPIEMTGRTVSLEMQSDRSRILTRNDLQRVELPNGARLFRYSRLGGQFWGFLHVPTDGNATVVLELAGTGTGGTSNPFADRIGVAANGQNAVMMLQTGGMYVVRLDGGRFASSNAPARFVSTQSPVLGPSMMVGSAFAFFETTRSGIDHMWRLPLADGGTPADVTPPFGVNDILRVEMAMSGDGRKVAFLQGPRNAWTLYLLGETGAAVALPPPPSKYEEPGYLPEGNGQPQLLLNQNGSRLFFLDSIINDETYLLDTTGALPMLHITDDTIFQPTIGVHILPSFIGTTFVVAIGNTVNNVNLMDWFRVDLTPAGGTVVNLTGTGSLLNPFPAGTLNPVQGAVVGTRVLTTDLTGTTQTLRSINPATATSAVLFTDVSTPPQTGTAINAVPDVVVTGAGSRLFSGATGLLVAALPDGVLLLPPASGPGYSVTWVRLASVNIGVVILYFGNTIVSSPIMSNVNQVVQTSTGALVIGTPTPSFLAPGIVAPLNVPPTTVGTVVSGAGG